MPTYAATTEAVRVAVQPVWLEAQSEPLAGKFVFAYFVEIENQGAEEVQLLRRHWTIRDADGRVEEVEGEGVVGRQPVIAPGETHRYNSFTVLRTFGGTMEGAYVVQRPSGARVRVQIPRFDLAAMAN